MWTQIAPNTFKLELTISKLIINVQKCLHSHGDFRLGIYYSATRQWSPRVINRFLILYLGKRSYNINIFKKRI